MPVYVLPVDVLVGVLVGVPVYMLVDVLLVLR